MNDPDDRNEDPDDEWCEECGKRNCVPGKVLCADCLEDAIWDDYWDKI